MKAYVKLIFIAMACALLGAQGIAMSETSPTVPPLRHILDISLEVSHTELIESSDVTLTFTINNSSEFDATDLYLASADGHHSESLGQLPAGESQIYTRTYTVSNEELSTGKLSFVISHNDIVPDGDPVTYIVEALIARADADPGLEFTRQISSCFVTEGTGVIITYRLYNAGNVPITQISVSDSLGGFSGHVEKLEPGESKVFSGRITVNSDVTSTPEVSYIADGEELSIRLDSADIVVVAPSISTSLTLDRQTAEAGESINGVITIAASGTDFSGIVVTDDINNIIIADTIELKDGETITLTCTWPVRDNAEFCVRVDAVSATGELVSAASETSVIEIVNSAASGEVTISANAQTPRINRPGKARILIAISNTGDAHVRDAVLSEASIGEIRKFDFIMAGEPTVKSLLVDVEDDTEFVFSISYVDGDGNTVKVESAPVSIVIADDGAEPAGDSGDDEMFANAYRPDDRALFFWMIGGGSAVLLVLVIILIVSHDRERRDRKQRLEKGRYRRQAPR